MATEIPIDALGTELKDLLDRIPSGESVTLIGPDGNARGTAHPAQSADGGSRLG